MPVRLPRPKPFRFCVQASAPPAGLTGTAADGPAWRELARRVEALGYDTLSVADHLDAQLAPTPALVAAAEATSTLRVGALVWCNDYHHPVVLAKEAATIDLLSDGRLEFGLGAGWMTTDYTEAGIALDPPATRVDRLTEAVGIVRRLLDGETVDHEGTHYRVSGHRLTPRPVQARVPILVGGGGRRVLSAAARLADVVGLNVNLAAGRIDERAGPNATVDATERKLAWIADAAGDRYDDLELQTRVHVTAVTDDRDGVAALHAPALGISPDAALASPHALAGTVDQLVDTVVERRERFGISVVTIGVEAFEDFAPVVARLAGT